MKFKKLLSMLITFVMVISVLPQGFTVVAAGAVEYEWLKPEAAILNMHMAGSSTFYKDSVVSANSPYNAYVKLYGGSFNEEINTHGKSLTWSGFNTSNIRKIAGAKYNNLYGNVSGEFYNNIHKHTWGNIFKKYSQEVVDYAGMSLEFGNMNAGAAYGSQSPWTKNYRDGNNRYMAIYCYDCSDTSKTLASTIEFEQPETEYDSGKKTCTHSEGSVKKVVASFGDLSAPTVKTVRTLKKEAGGNTETKYFVAGDTVVIELVFDEPVRFADNSALHSDLYLGLQLTGLVENPKAMLKSLKNTVMTFEYTVPDDLGEYRVANLDLTPLYGTDLPLVHIGANGDVISVTAPEADENGFTTTTSYITDISGNALSPISASTNLMPVEFYLDTVDPFVTKIVTTPKTNNGSVKKDLGKTDASAGDYRDGSDINLGKDDTIGYLIYMNEIITSKESGSDIKLIAETNLLDEYGEEIVLESNKRGTSPADAVGEQYGRAASNGYVSTFTFDPITIKSGYRIIDDEGNITSDTTQIKIINAYLEQAGSPTDLCGNAPANVQFEPQSVAQDTYYLDLQAPIVEFAGEDNGKVTPTPVGDGKEIRIAFTLDDSNLTTPDNESKPIPNGQTIDGVTNGGSGVNGLQGYFVLGDSGNRWCNFEYAVTASGETPSENDYKTGHLGGTSYFTMVEGNELHLYIRPLDDYTGYELYDPYIYIVGKDYAGNSEYDVNRRELDWMLDTKNPDIYRGKVTKALDGTGTGGTLTVEITAEDDGGLRSIGYIWGDDEQPADNADWQSLSLTEGEKQSENTIEKEVAIGENFSQHLWIRAEDMSGNVAIKNCGLQNYNLAGATYELNYTTAITAGAELKLANALDSNYYMAVLIPAESGSDAYYLHMMNGYNYNVFSQTIGTWDKVTLENSDGVYSFTKIENTDTSYIESVTTAKTFSGELSVTVLTVNSAGCDYLAGNDSFYFGDASYPANKEELVLRVSSNNNSAIPSFNLDNTILTTEDSSLAVFGDGSYAVGEPTVPSTLAGRQVKMTLGEATHSWGYEDIDWKNSYVLLSAKKNTSPRPVEYKVSLTPNQSVQYITLPDNSYMSGWWKIELYIVGTTGRAYDPIPISADGIDGYVFIDSTKTVTDFGFESLTSEPTHPISENEFPDGHKEYVGKNLLTDDETIYLPITDSQYVDSLKYMLYANQQNIEGNEEPHTSYYHPNDNSKSGYAGQFILKMWNITAGQTLDNAVEFNQTAVMYLNSKTPFEHIEKGEIQTDATKVPLIRNADNLIAMQIYSGNGNVSAIRTYKIRPVVTEFSGTFTSESIEYKGATSSISDKNKLVFTPDNDADMTDVVMFAAVRSESQGEIEKHIYFEAQADGTYTMPLEEGHKFYQIFAVDRYGGVKVIKYEYSKAMLDTQPPTLAANTVSVQDGIFEAEFVIEDTSFAGKQYYEEEYTIGFVKHVPLPMKLQLSFTGEYASRIEGGEGQVLTLTPEFTPLHAGNTFPAWSWKADGISETGIFEVTVDMDANTATYPAYSGTGKMTVKVKGLLKENEDDTQPFDLNLKLTATDYFGYTSEVEAAATQVTAIGAKYINDADTMPIWKWDSADGNEKLFIYFNSPVKPNESWANRNPKYGTEQAGAFPVAADGKHEIEYYDIFGDLVIAEIEVANQFGDYGLFIDYSPTTPTSDSVTVTIRHAQPEVGRYMKVWRENDNNTSTSIPPHGETEFTLNANSNATYFVSMYDSYEQGNGNSQATLGRKTFIYVNNIVTGAPDAELKFYFEEYGSEYTIDNLPQGETDGYVMVWYDTERNTTPTNNTEAEHRFEFGGSDSYTFHYVDDFGNAGSIAVDLSDLGVTLVTPTEPLIDEENPRVHISVSSKRFGVYSEADSIAGEDDIDRALQDISYVQAYSMKVNVVDDSAYKIVVLNAPPQSLAYSNAQSDAIEGISISGNIIKIDKAKAFTVAVVDSANNFSYISFTAEDFNPYFDTTPPTATPEIVAATLYDRTLYMSFEDKLDNGTVVSDNTMVTYPYMIKITDSQSGHFGKFRMDYTENAEETIRFTDSVGNSGSYKAVISGINNDAPVLTTTWSPPYVERDKDGNTISIDRNAPTKDAVNKSITAKITSDIPVKSATMEYSLDDAESWIPYDPETAGSVTMDFTSDIITVTFNADGCHARVTVTAPNGKQTEAYLTIDEGLIDKEITARVVYKDLIRDNATVPYGKEVVIESDEPVRYLEGTDYAALYNTYNPNTGAYDINPLKFTFYEAGERKVTLTDKAGNVKVLTISIDNVDMVSPTITTNPEDTLGLPLTSGKAQVGITIDEDAKVGIGTKIEDFVAGTEKAEEFTQNGVYDVTATDKAGNVSYSTISIGNIDNIVPNISFIKSTITVKQDTSIEEIKTLIEAGVTVWDNVDTDVSLNFDMTGVDASKVGVYPVTFTATDDAGNIGKATRYVKIYDKNIPSIYIDGEMAENGGTTVVSTGTHTLAVHGLKQIASGIDEPYTVKIRKGMCTEAQMKYFLSTVSIDANGQFDITEKGFYTVYVITQSRQSFRTLLYVE